MKKSIREAEWYHLVNTLPYQEVLDILEVEFGKREANELRKYMEGQTMCYLNGKSGAVGVYVVDLARFVHYRKKNLKAKDMPLDD